MLDLKMIKSEIQKVPVVDSPHNDAFEASVELYYQALGYITSSGKWFWVRDLRKKQRGYQDIDVLAIKNREVIIVSVTSSLDDKLRFDKKGQIREDMLKKLKAHFSRVQEYLSQVSEYKWLTKKKVKRVVAYTYSFDRYYEEVTDVLKQNGVELLSAKDMLSSINNYLADNNNIKV